MRFFPILQGLERIRAITDKQESDGWVQRRGDWARTVHLHYIGKERGVG